MFVKIYLPTVVFRLVLIDDRSDCVLHLPPPFSPYLLVRSYRHQWRNVWCTASGLGQAFDEYELEVFENVFVLLSLFEPIDDFCLSEWA